MKKNELKYLALFLFFACAKLFAQAGALDLTYATNGSVLTTYSPARFIADYSAMQEDGKVVLMGRYGFPVSGVDQIGLSRHRTDGTIDTTFGTNGFINININNKTFGYSFVIQPDGKIVLAGFIMNSSNNVSLLVIRLNPNGSFDNTFASNGVALFNNNVIGFSVKIQTDNKIVVGGKNLDSDFALVRLNPDGSLDNDFGFNGVVSTIITINNYESQINAINLQSDGKIVASGFTSLSFADNSFCTVRYNIDGSIDTSFGTNGKLIIDVNGASTDQILAQAIQQDGKIVVTGYAGQAVIVARYNSDGTLDAGFGTNGISSIAYGTYSISNFVFIQPDNKILIVGQSSLPTNKYIIARYTEIGILDTTFNFTGYNLGNFSPNSFITVPGLNIFHITAIPINGFTSGTVALFVIGFDTKNDELCNTPVLIELKSCEENTSSKQVATTINLNNMVIAPNPAKETTTISFENATSPTIEVYSLLGVKLATYNAKEAKGNWELNTSALPTGVYIVVMKENNSILLQKKLMKE
ncbi:T9SS type A sorting domain-containing protein [Flavobacterium sp.]